MKKDTYIIINAGKGDDPKRGIIDSQYGPQNRDRRRLGEGFTPVFVFGGDVTTQTYEGNPRPPGSPPIRGIGFPDQNDNTYSWSSPIGRSKELILIMSLQQEFAGDETPLVPDDSWTLIPDAQVDYSYSGTTARLELYWRRWKPGDPVYFDVENSWLRVSNIHLFGLEGVASGDKPFYAVTTSVEQTQTVSTPTVEAKSLDDMRVDFVHSIGGLFGYAFMAGEPIGNDKDFYYFGNLGYRTFQFTSTPIASFAGCAGTKEVNGVQITDNYDYGSSPVFQTISLMMKSAGRQFSRPIVGLPANVFNFDLTPNPNYQYAQKGDVQIVCGKAATKPVVDNWTFTKLTTFEGDDLYLGLSKSKSNRLPLPVELTNQITTTIGNPLSLSATGRNLSTKFEIVGVKQGTGLFATGTAGNARENEMIVDFLFTEIGDPLEPFGAKIWSNSTLDGFSPFGILDFAGTGYSPFRGYGTSTGSFSASQFELWQSVGWSVVTLKFKKR